MANPFTMSIETEPGKSHQHGFHLGTDERLARQLVVERYHGRVAAGMPTVTIALMRDGRMVDCWIGDKWQSDVEAAMYDDAADEEA